MPTSYDTYTGDNATTDFTVTFPYLDPLHITVTVDAVAQTKGVDWDFSDSTTVRFTTAPATDAVILIKRQSSQDTSLLTFSNAMLVADDLNTAYLHPFYMAQEILDGIEIGELDVTLDFNLVTDLTPEMGADIITNGYGFSIPSGFVLDIEYDGNLVARYSSAATQLTGTTTLVGSGGAASGILKINGAGGSPALYFQEEASTDNWYISAIAAVDFKFLNFTGDFHMVNYVFDMNQTVGAGQDNYVLTYDNGTGKISLEAASTPTVALNDVTDVTITSAIAGDYIRYSGSAWVDVTVSQLETDINHDNLTGFVANEHIDWTSTSSNFSTSGTLGAGAITATSYDGVAAANLLDKSAAETVTGVYTFDSAIWMTETGTPPAITAGYGSFWVENEAPSVPSFTGDDSLDYRMGFASYKLSAASTLDHLNETGATIDATYLNGLWIKTDTSADTLTLEASSSENFPVGGQLTIINRGSSGNMSVTDTATQTLYILDGASITDSAGGADIAPGGYATLVRISTTEALIMGAGVS